MEKKNMVLLTVIAVATLLVAVVGATFAYFTATFTEAGDSTNKDVTVNTRTLTNVTFTYGTNIEATDKVYPGWKAMRALHVTGSGDEGSDSVTVTLTLTPNVTDFGTHVKYTLYKATGEDDSTDPEADGFCTASNVVQEQDGNNVKFHDAMTCTPTKAIVVSGHNGVSFSGTTAVNYDITVSRDTNEWYYVVIEYEDDGDQKAEQGQTFTVNMNAKLKPQT